MGELSIQIDSLTLDASMNGTDAVAAAIAARTGQALDPETLRLVSEAVRGAIAQSHLADHQAP